MPKTVTTTTRSIVSNSQSGKGSVTAIVINTLPAIGRISLHDCASPDQAGAHNEIWPRGAGGSISFNIGLVVHTTDANSPGNVTITTA